MPNAAQQILAAVQGDTDAIRALAAAIARNDVAAIQGVLTARGVSVTDAELTSIVSGAADANSMTCTCTCTCT
jgi:uncharacterized protein (DUF58 family)